MFVVLQSSTNSYLHYKVRTKVRLFFETSNNSWIIFLISCIITHSQTSYPRPSLQKK